MYRGVLFLALLLASTAAAGGSARAQGAPQQLVQPLGQQLPGGPGDLRRLDPNALPQTDNLAGGDYGIERQRSEPLAGGDYGTARPDDAPLAGGDYGLPTRPEPDTVTIAPSALSDPLGAAPRGFRPLRRAQAPAAQADDPYAPVGVRAGTFVLRPTLETAAGYDTNPTRRPAPDRGSSFGRLRGAIEGQSDWSRHELVFRGSAQTRHFFSVPGAGYEPDINGTVDGRVDVTERTQINTQLRGAIAASRPGDPETPSTIDGDEITRSAGATLGVAHRFNRFALRLDGLVDRYTVDDAKTRNGQRIDNADRAYNSYETRLRGSYELSPKLAPFVEVAVDKRDYDRKREIVESGTGRLLGSDGYALRGGAQFELTRLVTGEAAIGYGRQTPKDKNLKDVEGLLIDGSVAWAPSALTTVRLNARTGLQETTLQNSGGVLSRSVEAAVEHKLRRNFIVTATAGVENADYKGTRPHRVDKTTTLGLEGEYRFNRNVALTGSYQKLWLNSSLPGEDYTASIVEFGLRFRR